MTLHRPVRSGAFLEIVGVAVLWALLSFALVVGICFLLSSMFSWQIGQLLGVFGIQTG